MYLPGDSWPVSNNILGVVLWMVLGVVFGAVLLVMAWNRERRRRRHAAASRVNAI